MPHTYHRNNPQSPHTVRAIAPILCGPQPTAPITPVDLIAQIITNFALLVSLLSHIIKVCSVWCVVCGVWGVVCTVCSVRCVRCGVWCAVCSVWCV